jgi:hypothetical protein
MSRTLQSVDDAAMAIEAGAKTIPAIAGEIGTTLDAISGSRGTLYQANKAIVKVGDAIVTTQLQERAIAPHTIAAVDGLKFAAAKLGNSADSLSKTADAATGLTVALTTDAQTANQTIAAAQPVLGQMGQDAADLDALLKDRAVTDTLTNVQFVTQNLGGITADFGRVTKKAADDYTTPRTPWKSLLIKAGDTYDLAGFFARHY